MSRATGDFLMFLDDDDEFAPGAIDLARSWVARNPRAMHVGRMKYADGRTLPVPLDPPWDSLRAGNIGTPCGVLPRIATLGPSQGSALPARWPAGHYETDFYFYLDAAKYYCGIIWHPEVIALVRPRG